MKKETMKMEASNQPVNDGQPKADGDGSQRVITAEELAKVNAKNAELLAELRKIKDIGKAKLEQELKEKEDFKKLAEIRDEELKVIRQELEAKKAKELNENKLFALMDTLKTTIEHKYLPLIDLGAIVVDATGKVDEFSVARYADKLKQEYPILFQEKKPIAMPTGAPQPNVGTKITYDEWKKLDAKEMAKRMKDIIDQ